MRKNLRNLISVMIDMSVTGAGVTLAIIGIVKTFIDASKE